MDEAADRLQQLSEHIYNGVSARLQRERTRLQGCRQRIPASSIRCLSQARLQLAGARKDLHRAVDALLTRQRHRLELLQQRITDASPQKQLARGYSITLKDGRAVKDASSLKPGDVLTTRVYKGEIQSIVKPKN